MDRRQKLKKKQTLGRMIEIKAGPRSTSSLAISMKLNESLPAKETEQDMMTAMIHRLQSESNELKVSEKSSTSPRNKRMDRSFIRRISAGRLQ
jgi:hypothetical protein